METKITMLPVAMLHPHRDNPRKALGDLTELAESIKANGVMQNLTVLPVGSKGVFCSRKCRTASYEKTRRAMKCAVCGADMPPLRRMYCSDRCRKKGEKIKAGKAAVKSDGFAEYEKASIDAMKRGEKLTYGRFMAQKITEG